MRSRWIRVRYVGEYVLFRIAAALFKAMGLETASNVSGWIWRRLAPLTYRHGRAVAHLRRAFPDKSRADCEALARDMWENLGRTLGEWFHLPELVASDRISYEHFEAAERWASNPGGKVAISGHLGNWEIAILGVTRTGEKPWSIYRPIANPWIDRYAWRKRRFLYTGGLVPKTPATPRQFIKLIRSGETVAFLGDQRFASGRRVQVFGQEAASTIFPAILAHSVKSPILMCYMRRLPGVRFVETFDLVEIPSSGDRDADIAIVTERVQTIFERYVREAPAQWMWAHRRWD